MTDQQSFIYDFIFQFGDFFPFKVIFLNANFFNKFGERLSYFPKSEIIIDYKTFLLDQRSQSESISSIDELLLNWTKAFIACELIDIEYRKKSIREITFEEDLFKSIVDLLIVESIPKKLKLSAGYNRIHFSNPFCCMINPTSNVFLTSLFVIKYIDFSMIDPS